jgi:hypothetical protein
LREIRMPVRCTACETDFKYSMTVSYAADLVSCIQAALAAMPCVDGRVFPPKRGHDG